MLNYINKSVLTKDGATEKGMQESMGCLGARGVWGGIMAIVMVIGKAPQHGIILTN